MKKNKIFYKFLFIIVGIYFVLHVQYSSAKPMNVPTKKEAYKSEFIVIGEYIGYQAKEGISYFQGPVAKFKTIRILKGVGLPKTLNIRYDFHDGSACIHLEDWKFSKSIMPKSGSLWILFINKDKENKVFITYRGDFGRWEATKENIAEAEKALKK
ncbi:MAG: hypothetical protein HQ538_02180 [Parcubacteria group bacterium]|nr:hypothetical protein [Parcubacteria group bacterium]